MKEQKAEGRRQPQRKAFRSYCLLPSSFTSSLIPHPSSLLSCAARRMLKCLFEDNAMLHQNTLDPLHTTLAIIDMQEGFRSVISDFAETAVRIALVAHAAQLLNIPVIVTEQYPKGLGHTANEIKAVLPADFNFIEK